jgi:hypothetical protein
MLKPPSIKNIISKRMLGVLNKKPYGINPEERCGNGVLTVTIRS